MDHPSQTLAAIAMVAFWWSWFCSATCWSLSRGCNSPAANPAASVQWLFLQRSPYIENITSTEIEKNLGNLWWYFEGYLPKYKRIEVFIAQLPFLGTDTIRPFWPCSQRGQLSTALKSFFGPCCRGNGTLFFLWNLKTFHLTIRGEAVGSPL